MSDPNANTKKRQMFILGGAGVGILALIGAGMFLFEGPSPTPKEKPKTVSLTPPGTVDDKDAWRANEAARNQANQTTLDETKNKVKNQDETIKRLSKELEDLRMGKGQSTAVAPAAATGKSMTSEEAARKVLDTPLPPGGQRVLNSPNGTAMAGAGARPGAMSPPGQLNFPINGQASSQPQPQREAIEMINFGGATVPPTAGVTGGTAPGAEVVGFPVDERAKKVQEPKVRADAEKKTSIEFIPAGSFVRVEMLNGVDAPTGGQAQSNPLPMAFHVLDTANLANRYKLDIRDCRIIAAAWGDLSSERTMGRTETLTCIIGGETVEMPIKGQVIGEDGKAGMRGRLVTKQGQLLANALFAGSLSGIGRAFQAGATTTTTGSAGIAQSIDPDKLAQAGIGGGVSQAATMLANYYLKAADKLFPVIETDGGRIVEVLITKGAVYQGKAGNRDTYRSLLKRAGSQSRSNDDD